MKNFVEISTILVLFNKIKIRTQFLISPEILTAQKRQTTFWKFQDCENLAVIVSRLNVTNKFQDQRRLSSRLATVMFRRTLCI